MKMMKRILSVLLCCMVIASGLMVGAHGFSLFGKTETQAVAQLTMKDYQYNNQKETKTEAENRDYVYWYLRNELGFSIAGACGALGNIWIESNFHPVCDSGSYHGICQWGTGAGNGNRWTTGEQGYDGCQSYCNRVGLDYQSIEGQCAFIKYEFTKVPGIKKYLSTFQNATSYEDAADQWRLHYEMCGNQTVDQRRINAGIYYNQYKQSSNKPLLPRSYWKEHTSSGSDPDLSWFLNNDPNNYEFDMPGDFFIYFFWAIFYGVFNQ